MLDGLDGDPDCAPKSMLGLTSLVNGAAAVTVA
jgi:hypothetical protein